MSAAKIANHHKIAERERRLIMTITGSFEGYEQRDLDSNKAIFRLRDTDTNTKYMCEATSFPRDVLMYSRLQLEGEIYCDEMPAPHRLYKGFSVSSYKIVAHVDQESAAAFIQNLGVKGIGEATARAIVSITGPDIKTYLLLHPDVDDLADQVNAIVKVKAVAISGDHIDRLQEKMRGKSELKTVCDYLYRFGFTAKESELLFDLIQKDLGKEPDLDAVKKALSPKLAKNTLSKSCYGHCIPKGIPFLAVDRLAKELGYSAYNPERIKYLVYAVMVKNQERGHLFASIEDICRMADTLCKDSEFDEKEISIYALWAEIIKNPGTFIEEECGKRVFFYKAWRSEMNTAVRLNALDKSTKRFAFNAAVIDGLEAKKGIKFSVAQKKCFGLLGRAGVKIITGGAGTGKTTTISGIIEAFTELNPDAKVALCAPTGRAAQRMTELCRSFGDTVKASTIHRLLEFCPFGTETRYNSDNPLPFDLIVVDEMSMVDARLFSLFVDAVRDDTLLILCGDPSQLPPVSAGKVFKDLIDSQHFTLVKLTNTYRQAAGSSSIIDNANKVNEGNALIATDSNFSFVVMNTAEEMRDKAIELLKGDSDITVLSPIKSGVAGTIEVNKHLQPLLNPNVNQPNAFSLLTAAGRFYIGDRVLFNKNNYQTGYVNGDVGVVTKIVGGALEVKIGYETKFIAGKDISDLSLAYSITIHKAQGSESDTIAVIIPPEAEFMLSRNILYTAITRAKKKLILIGRENCIAEAVINISGVSRRTSLKDKLLMDDIELRRLLTAAVENIKRKELKR
ncbi:MAG: AAA family ATPase [Bacteroidaceae bacterium]|nr:AAA family ATPase [Bacteroidaceae bacterium]